MAFLPIVQIKNAGRRTIYGQRIKSPFNVCFLIPVNGARPTPTPNPPQMSKCRAVNAPEAAVQSSWPLRVLIHPLTVSYLVPLPARIDNGAGASLGDGYQPWSKARRSPRAGCAGVRAGALASGPRGARPRPSRGSHPIRTGGVPAAGRPGTSLRPRRSPLRSAGGPGWRSCLGPAGTEALRCAPRRAASSGQQVSARLPTARPARAHPAQAVHEHARVQVAGDGGAGQVLQVHLLHRTVDEAPVAAALVGLGRPRERREGSQGGPGPRSRFSRVGRFPERGPGRAVLHPRARASPPAEPGSRAGARRSPVRRLRLTPSGSRRRPPRSPRLRRRGLRRRSRAPSAGRSSGSLSGGGPFKAGLRSVVVSRPPRKQSQ